MDEVQCFGEKLKTIQDKQPRWANIYSKLRLHDYPLTLGNDAILASASCCSVIPLKS
jgi:hypothetical protein